MEGVTQAQHDRIAALQAQATRVQVRPGGLITDYLGCGPLAGAEGDVHVRGEGGSGRLGLSRCVHGREWPEAGTSADGVCVDCVTKTAAVTP